MDKLSVLLAGLIIGGSLAAQAQVPRPLDNLPFGYPPSPREKIPPPPSRESGDNLRPLDLTSEQKKQIQQLKESDELSLLSARDGVLIARVILESALRESPQDAIGIQAKSEDLAKDVARLIVQQSIHESKFLQILTIDQREKLSDTQPCEPPFEDFGLNRPIPPPSDRIEPESMHDAGFDSDYDPALGPDFDEDFD